MDELSASEALFGFVGWLTARDKQVVFSGRDHAAPAVELVAEFCKANGLAEPREDWTTRLTMPPTSALTQRAPDLANVPPHCEHGYNGLCPTCDAMQTPPSG